MVASFFTMVIGLTCLAIAADRMTSEVPLMDDGKRLQLLQGVSLKRAGASFVFALIVGAVNLFVKEGWATSLLDGWLAIPCLLLVIAVHVAIMYWWLIDGYRWRQLLPFAAMLFVIYFTTKGAAAAVAAIGGAEWSQKAIFALPDLIAVVEGMILIGTLLFLSIKKANDGR